MKKIMILLIILTIALVAAVPAFAHQHLANPSGFCVDDNASVPQGIANPAGNMPGGRNSANQDSEFSGVQNCQTSE